MKRTPAAGMLALMAITTCSPGDDTARRPFEVDDMFRLRQPASAMLSLDGRRLAYVLGDSLRVASADPRNASDSIDNAVSGGMSNQVHYSRPFMAWSTGSDAIVFRRGGGGSSEQGELAVHDLDADEVRMLLPDSLASRLQTFLVWTAGGPAWSPDDRHIAFLAVDPERDASHLHVWVADLPSGEVRPWIADSTGPFGGVQSVAFSPDGRWLASATGAFAGDAGRIALLPMDDPDSPPVTIVEGGASMYRDLIWSADGKYLAATAGTSQPRSLFLRIESGPRAVPVEPPEPADAPSYVAGWIGGGPRTFGHKRTGMSARLVIGDAVAGTTRFITPADTLYSALGIAQAAGGPVVAWSVESGAAPLDVWTAALTDAGLESPRRVTRANAWLDSVALASATIFRWKADSATLEAQLFLPPSARPNDRVPLVILPYGGYVNEFPKAEYFLTAGIQVLASRGYAVILPNTRDGNAEPRGYGRQELADTELLIDALDRAALIDTARISIMGHSHGGAMTYYYLTHSPRWCAAVAINGWTDWSEIAGRLRVSEEETPAALDEASPILNIEAVNTPLLAVSGANDTQVLPHNAERIVDALTAIGKPATLLHFPDEGHLIEKPANARRFWERTLDFLTSSCSPDGRSS